MFAITTHDPENEDGHIIDNVGETIAKHEREERYGDGTGPYCIGGEDGDSEDGFDAPLVDCAYTSGLLHLLTTNLNLKLMLGMCLMRTEMCIQLQQL